jgi:hypothetical protein
MYNLISFMTNYLMALFQGNYKQFQSHVSIMTKM